MSAAYSSLISVKCSEYPPAAAIHDRSLLRNDMIALISIYFCSKLFHSCQSFSCAVLLSLGMYLW